VAENRHQGHHQTVSDEKKGMSNFASGLPEAFLFPNKKLPGEAREFLNLI
jgi:hypothetical protein